MCSIDAGCSPGTYVACVACVAAVLLLRSALMLLHAAYIVAQATFARTVELICLILAAMAAAPKTAAA
eukprot:1159400-Pyramimonas_sp.AAC.1